MGGSMSTPSSSSEAKPATTANNPAIVKPPGASTTTQSPNVKPPGASSTTQASSNVSTKTTMGGNYKNHKSRRKYKKQKRSKKNIK
jgi:hypothetical protein